MIASSHWECLGFGHTDDGNQWAVTYFAKTLFTPAGIDIYSRKKEGLQEDVISKISDGLKAFEVKEIKDLVDSMFPVLQN